MGALSCTKILDGSKLKLIFLLNAILVTGVGISLIGQWIWLMCIGRFIWGFAYGAFSVVCAKMINEIAPVELVGTLGAVNQLALAFGSTLPSSLALLYPRDIRTTTDPANEFYVNGYFRIIWSIPLVIAAI